MTAVAATSSGLLTLQTEQDRETVGGGYAGAFAVLMFERAPASSEIGFPNKLGRGGRACGVIVGGLPPEDRRGVPPTP
jgi:hypothetical protein